MAAAEGLHYLSLAAGGGTAQVGGAFCWYSTSYVAAFNGAGLFSDHLVNNETLAAIEDFFRDHGRPYAMVTLDGLADRAMRVLPGLGYSEFDSSPAMWLEGPPLRWQPPPPGMSVYRVKTTGELRIFRAIISKVFHISPLETDVILSDEVLEISNVRHYIAALGDVPVATATMVISGSVPGIWNVGTLVEYRRRGISAELMRFLTAEAGALGYNSTMLLASPDGLPLYKRLGYRTISTLRMLGPARQPGYGVV